jgi:hypothetical protein
MVSTELSSETFINKWGNGEESILERVVFPHPGDPHRRTLCDNPFKKILEIL